MRKWLLAGLLVLMFPWVLSLFWMGIVGKRMESDTASLMESVHVEIVEASELEMEKNVEEGSGSEEVVENQMDRRILMERDGVSTYMDLEAYLPGIVLCQTEPGTELEALKCQAVIARTYICRLLDGRLELDEKALDLTHPGTYDRGILTDRETAVSELERCEEAVAATQGMVMQYDGRCILPMFHKISAGRTRTGIADFPYLQAVESRWDTKVVGYQTQMEWGSREFADRISAISGGQSVLTGESAKQLQVVQKDDSGYVTQIKIGAKTYTGDEVQYALGLPSSAFSLHVENGSIVARVTGNGHGYGLSQAGAESMARDGWNFEEILHYYYKNISLVSE